MLNDFSKELSAFSRSSLEDSKAMSFLNRFDTKYVMKTQTALDFLKNISSDYSVLQISNDVVQNYATVYFDTEDLLCFNLHHNKRANRFKVRTRLYLSNGKIFNEIKQKINTGKTLKIRQCRTKEKSIPLKQLDEFDTPFKSLMENSGYKMTDLLPQLSVFFSRITLLNKHFPERMTLDFGLRYGFEDRGIALQDTAIIEFKREKSPEKTVAQEYLRSIHKQPSGFSKYTIGICLTHEQAKKNRFLPRIRKLSYSSATQEKSANGLILPSIYNKTEPQESGLINGTLHNATIQKGVEI